MEEILPIISPLVADMEGSPESPCLRYEHLSKTEIRLLRKSQPPPNVEYELVHFDREKAKDMGYIAVSYTWGDDTLSHTIPFAGGEMLPTRDNLHKVLKHPRLMETEKFIWIDAVCINQNDMAEKAVQVTQMRKIYSCAEKVLVWVGEPDLDSRLSMNAFGRLKQYFHNVEQASMFGNPEIRQSVRRFFLEMDLFTHPDWNLSCIGRFIGRSWFERVWIIQEVVLGKDVEIICGKQSIDWNDFSCVIQSLARYNLVKLLTDPAKRIAPTRFSTCLALTFWRDAELSGICHSRDLVRLLIGSSEFKATNPRDKIYALLGISSSLNSGIVVDYERSTQHTFTQAARCMALGSSGILMLSAAGIGFPRSLDDMPSWVPDWTSTPGRTILHPLIHAGYKATDGNNSRIRALSDPKLLAVDGIYIDHITALHELPPVPILHVQNAEEMAVTNILDQAFIKSSTDFALQIDQSLYLKGHEEILWRTLCANIDEEGLPLLPAHAICYHSFITLGDYLVERPSGWPQEQDEQFTIRSLQAAAHSKAWQLIGKSRRLCRTAGGFLGLVAPETKVGDLVCLLLGGITPFILRKSDPTPVGDSTHVLVGECYVHGLMNLEGMKMGDVQEFVLR